MVLTCAALHTLKCIFLKHLRPKPVSHNQSRVSKAQTTKILLYNSYLSVFSHHTLTGGTAANLQPEHPDKKSLVVFCDFQHYQSSYLTAKADVES